MLFCRYNISTGDYDQWDDSSINGSLESENAQVYNGNQQESQLQNRRISNVSNIYTQFGLNFDQARSVSTMESIGDLENRDGVGGGGGKRKRENHGCLCDDCKEGSYSKKIYIYME